MSDWLEELTPDERSEWDRFVEDYRRDGLEKLTQSAVMISLVPDNTDLDVRFSLELGAAIMLNKPIIAVVQSGVTISPKLRLVADAVVEDDIDTEEGREALLAAMTRVLS